MLDQSKNRFELEGPGYLIQKAGGFEFRVNHLSFFQVNRFLVEDLLQTMVGGAKGGYALDLYAGVGFFTLPLAKAFSKVVSVDANLSATRDLRQNAEIAGASIVSENEHTEDFLKKSCRRSRIWWCLILLGQGLERKLRRGWRIWARSDISYLSCDPATLARDLAVLTGSERKPESPVSAEHKYEIAEVHLFDLFPQTFHIETLVRLRRVS